MVKILFETGSLINQRFSYLLLVHCKSPVAAGTWRKENNLQIKDKKNKEINQIK